MKFSNTSRYPILSPFKASVDSSFNSNSFHIDFKEKRRNSTNRNQFYFLNRPKILMTPITDFQKLISGNSNNQNEKISPKFILQNTPIPLPPDLKEKIVPNNLIYKKNIKNARNPWDPLSFLNLNASLNSKNSKIFKGHKEMYPQIKPFHNINYLVGLSKIKYGYNLSNLDNYHKKFLQINQDKRISNFINKAKTKAIFENKNYKNLNFSSKTPKESSFTNQNTKYENKSIQEKNSPRKII